MSDIYKLEDLVGKDWVAIEGSVYDVTDFIAEHPGGPKILKKNCGKDSTELFWQFHNKKILAKVAPKYKIGTLAVVAKL